MAQFLQIAMGSASELECINRDAGARITAQIVDVKEYARRIPEIPPRSAQPQLRALTT